MILPRLIHSVKVKRNYEIEIEFSIDFHQLSVVFDSPEWGVVLSEANRIQATSGCLSGAKLFVHEELKTTYGFVQSMSRKGNCWDNVPMESFFGTLKTELIYHEDYQTRRQARASIFEYVETFFNRVRLQEKLGFLSLESYEKLRFSA